MNRILNYLKNVVNSINWQNQAILIYLLSAILITLPLKYIFGSLACLLFILFNLFKVKKSYFSISGLLLLPILLYILMVFSLIWTIDIRETIKGLQKEALFLFIPIVFLFLPQLTKETVNKVLKTYSFAMVGYAVFYMVKAVIRFLNTGNKNVFFYHELVTLNLNAIYVSIFASMAMFFFLRKREKEILDKIAFLILVLFIFLLSSKNIILIDLLLVILYFFSFSNFSKKIKVVTISFSVVLVVCSILFVTPIRDRFMIEFDTVIQDSSVNATDKSITNISVKQAWNNYSFQENNFFSGTALRVFQIRIFKEMLQQENIFFTGFGLDASQEKIKQKVKEHNLHSSYGEFNFHNEYIQIFSELGVFGFLIVASMLFVTVRKGIINKDFVHIAFAVTMIVLFLTESFLSRQRGIIFFIIFYCMLNVADNSNEQKILK